MKIAYLSDIGRVRENNEDYIGAFQNKSGATMVLVADGVGGHNGGEVASEMAVSHLGYYFGETSFYSIDQASAWLNKQVEKENNIILENASKYSDLSGMGTTLVVAIIFSQGILVANIGDSRGYLYRLSKLEQLTEDHSYVNELIKRGEISKEDAQLHPQKNVITRSLGISDTAELDEKVIPILRGQMLLLCTDGLTNLVTDEQITEILNVSETLEDKCQRLINAANDAGGNDNVSVLLVSFDEEEI